VDSNLFGQEWSYTTAASEFPIAVVTGTDRGHVVSIHSTAWGLGHRQEQVVERKRLRSCMRGCAGSGNWPVIAHEKKMSPMTTIDHG
jgi:hypothetical protein